MSQGYIILFQLPFFVFVCSNNSWNTGKTLREIYWLNLHDFRDAKRSSEVFCCSFAIEGYAGMENQFFKLMKKYLHFYSEASQLYRALAAFSYKKKIVFVLCFFN